jgi:DNA-directed RNA polymerase subunit RPC12/RpoP
MTHPDEGAKRGPVNPAPDVPPTEVRREVIFLRCLRCGHEWMPRASTPTPKQCPSCRSRSWSTPRIYNTRSGGKAAPDVKGQARGKPFAKGVDERRIT